MARPKAKAPARQYHISGQSVVRIAGRDIYLGKHDSPESIARYAVLVGIYQDNGLMLPEDFDASTLDERAAILLGQSAPGAVASQQAEQVFLVRHVTASYRQHIATKYADSPAELHRLGQVCDQLDKADGDVLADDYGPLRLQHQRQRWIDEGKARVYCNRLTNAVIRIWKYAVAQELVAESCWRRLRAVEALRIGQTAAPEKEPIGPVDIAVVRATSKELTPVLKAMIRIHVATGMRPSELCRIRPRDIDRSGDVWVYRPKKHKNANRGKLKAVPLIGDAREAIIDYLARDPDAYCFSPAESMAWHRARQRANRKTKVQPSQVSRANGNPRKQPGECFTSTSYRQSIQRAAKRAKVQHWFPYQIRHLAGTVIRDALGVEAAQAVLGHSRVSMTEHYAKQSLQKAIDAAKVAPKL